MQSARTLIENLLTQGELEAAINGCLLLHRHHGDTEGTSATAQLSARYHALMAQQRDGTISQEENRLERARINRAMLDGMQKMPAVWTAEPLVAGGFSAHIPAGVPQQKSVVGKWGLALGLAACLLVIAGITLRERIFPKTTTAVEQPSDSKPDVHSTAQQPQQSTAAAQPQTESATKKGVVPPVHKPVSDGTKPSVQPSVQTPPTESKSDNRFRSFGKTVFADGMELGKMNGKMAFRNIKTNEVLCCYADAEHFSDGKANVSIDGVTYFYINKKGDKVE